MYLAKSRDGRIGRQVPGPNEQAVIHSPIQAERHGDVYVSEAKIAHDHEFYAQEDAKEQALIAEKRLAEVRSRRQELEDEIARRQEIESFERLSRINPLNTMLKQYFTKQSTMSETEKVSNSLAHDGGESRRQSERIIQNPADFAADSNKPEIVLANEDKRPITWRADFRQHLMVGSPLTRDGAFGPAVTDFDRFVQGTDVNQSDVVDVAGGTILGRYGGEQMTETWEEAEKRKAEELKAQALEQAASMRRGPSIQMWLPTINIPNIPTRDAAAQSGMSGMAPTGAYGAETSARRALSGPMAPTGAYGAETSARRALSGPRDWEMPSWGDITDWAGGVLDQTVDKIEDQLPEQLAKELQEAITGGGQVTKSPTGQITVTRPVVSTTYPASAGGIPPWALYTGLAIGGLGVMLLFVRALK